MLWGVQLSDLGLKPDLVLKPTTARAALAGSHGEGVSVGKRRAAVRGVDFPRVPGRAVRPDTVQRALWLRLVGVLTVALGCFLHEKREEE